MLASFLYALYSVFTCPYARGAAFWTRLRLVEASVWGLTVKYSAKSFEKALEKSVFFECDYHILRAGRLVSASVTKAYWRKALIDLDKKDDYIL